jgi:hypothetical protein
MDKNPRNPLSAADQSNLQNQKRKIRHQTAHRHTVQQTNPIATTKATTKLTNKRKNNLKTTSHKPKSQGPHSSKLRQQTKMNPQTNRRPFPAFPHALTPTFYASTFSSGNSTPKVNSPTSRTILGFADPLLKPIQ